MPLHHWPLFGLRVRTPRLELRGIDDELAGQLADLATEGVHEPDTMPFSVPWTRVPPEELRVNYLRFHWERRAAVSPERWTLNLAVLVDGEPVGVQDAMAEGFRVRRTFESGSWLGRRFQGRGLGTEMRHAILHLGFAGLGAEVADTSCWDDNPASYAVTRKLGYVENGWHLRDREGVARRMRFFHLERPGWEARRRDDITIEGLEPCLELLELAPAVG